MLDEEDIKARAPITQGDQKRSRIPYAVAAFALVVLAAAGVIGYFAYKESTKYAPLYARLNIPEIPRYVANVPFIQKDLAALAQAPCNTEAGRSLIDDLDELGHKELARVVRIGIAKSCLPHADPPRPANGSPPERPAPGDALSHASSSKKQDVMRAVDSLRQNMCDQPNTLKVIGYFHGISDSKDAQIVGEQFLRKCQPDSSVAYLTMKSNFWLGDYNRAFIINFEYSKLEPSSPYWAAWQGHILQKMNRKNEAADAFLRSLSLWPSPETVAYSDFERTSNALSDVGRYCEAGEVIERYISYDTSKRFTPAMRSLVDGIKTKGSCRDKPTRSSAIGGKLTRELVNAFGKSLLKCWDSADAKYPNDITVDVMVYLAPDGSLSSRPEVQNMKAGSDHQRLYENAVKAIQACQPYTMFLDKPHQDWSMVPVVIYGSFANGALK